MDSGDQIVLEGKRKQRKHKVTVINFSDKLQISVDQSSGSFTGFLSAFTHHTPIHVKWKQRARGLVKKNKQKKHYKMINTVAKSNTRGFLAGTEKRVDLLLKVKRHHEAFTAAENTNLDSSQSKYSNIRANQEHYGKEQ